MRLITHRGMLLSLWAQLGVGGMRGKVLGYLLVPLGSQVTAGVNHASVQQLFLRAWMERAETLFPQVADFGQCRMEVGRALMHGGRRQLGDLTLALALLPIIIATGP
jgi:hypothetical protein